jgi:hypothetical protein
LNQFDRGDNAIMIGTLLRNPRSQGAMFLLSDPTSQIVLLTAALVILSGRDAARHVLRKFSDLDDRED